MTRKERYHYVIQYFSQHNPVAETELLYSNPYELLVAVILSAQCTDKRVNLTTPSFFKRYPDAVEAELADPTEMAELIASLGFKNRRTRQIQRFSSDWMTLDWIEPSELYGIGKYAQDSWEIFQKGNLNVEPTDGVLNTYLHWAKTKTLYSI